MELKRKCLNVVLKSEKERPWKEIAETQEHGG